MQILILALLAFPSSIGFVQDTTTIDQYCRLIISESLATTKVRIDIDMGDEKKLSANDARLRDELTSKLKDLIQLWMR